MPVRDQIKSNPVQQSRVIITIGIESITKSHQNVQLVINNKEQTKIITIPVQKNSNTCCIIALTNFI